MENVRRRSKIKYSGHIRIGLIRRLTRFFSSVRTGHGHWSKKQKWAMMMGGQKKAHLLASLQALDLPVTVLAIFILSRSLTIIICAYARAASPTNDDATDARNAWNATDF